MTQAKIEPRMVAFDAYVNLEFSQDSTADRAATLVAVICDDLLCDEEPATEDEAALPRMPGLDASTVEAACVIQYEAVTLGMIGREIGDRPDPEPLFVARLNALMELQDLEHDLDYNDFATLDEARREFPIIRSLCTGFGVLRNTILDHMDRIDRSIEARRPTAVILEFPGRSAAGPQP